MLWGWAKEYSSSNERQICYAIPPQSYQWVKSEPSELVDALLMFPDRVKVDDGQWFWCCVFGCIQIHIAVYELIHILSFIKWKCLPSMGLANRTRMWCLISQPNCVIIEVKVDPKAKGQECLEKVIFRCFRPFCIWEFCLRCFCHQPVLGYFRNKLCQYQG